MRCVFENISHLAAWRGFFFFFFFFLGKSKCTQEEYELQAIANIKRNLFCGTPGAGAGPQNQIFFLQRGIPKQAFNVKVVLAFRVLGNTVVEIPLVAPPRRTPNVMAWQSSWSRRWRLQSGR
jgi:hypothetical protein